MPQDFKQVIVVNEALQLPRGKLAAQVAHASIAAFLESDLKEQEIWLEQGMPKVVLRAESVTQLMQLAEQARGRKLPHYLIRDAGRTVIAAGTVTCLGIGPAPVEAIDELTGQLKLVR
jgi:peptidyl-tRNA hydrolase